MTTTNRIQRIALCLILIFTVSAITFANATTENNYNNDTNLLPNIFECTYTENGYKANIMINPDAVGIYASENGYKLDLAINPTGIGGSLKENNYQLDLVPEKTFPDNPDIAVTSIVTSKTVVGQGYSTLINVTITNQALNYETFPIILYANATSIGRQTTTLTSRSSTTIAFTWNTTGFAKGNYTISAYAEPLPGEMDQSDNNFAGGTVFVTILGDVNGDKRVNILDCILIANHFGHVDGDGHTLGSKEWFDCVNCDINSDAKTNVLDCIILSNNFNKSWT
jgi:hypothetical protein